jgi:hypothetical protein
MFKTVVTDPDMSDTGFSTEETDEITEEDNDDMVCITQRRCEK